ncbi:hypothetical protein M514_28006 [Trichuris suis]|uniref:Integrase catalytic domain-containing protein n=1 Tax=Trichuris suis TaxID=68888 RepID=A0A085MRG8_9BILA|nr:hypothetical protein M514_28006 [Trichuris suis]
MAAKDVHHAPELAVNLLSVSRIASHGKSLIFDINGCRIVDACGPMQVRSFGGARYFISFIDDFSRKSFVYFPKNKNEALQELKEFVAFVERKTSRKVKCLRTNNGRECVDDYFAQFLTANGIRHGRSVPDTPEQNGIAERLNRTLVEKARTMLIDAGLSYRTINRFTKKPNIARDVVFLESSFPGTRQTNAHLGEQEKFAPDDGEEVIIWKLQDDKPSGTEADKTVSSPIEGRESPCCDTVNEDAQTNEGRPKRNRVPNRTIFNSDFVYQAGMHEGDAVSYADAIRRPDAHDWLAAVRNA